MGPPADLSRIAGPDALARGLMTAGRHTYGLESLTVRHWDEPARLHVGAFCSLGPECVVFLGGNHRTDWVTTYPFTALDAWKPAEPIAGHPATKGDVTIGSDVWVGAGVTIMSGVDVGHGAVLGACSVVTADVAPYSIVAGNPARRRRSRFPRRDVRRLLDLAWWDWSDEKIRAHVPQLCSADVRSLLA